MKEFTKDILEILWYTFFICFAWDMLARYHYADSAKDMEWYWYLLVIAVTFYGGAYLIRKYEMWLWKKKVMKLAKEIAKIQGMNPDTLDFEDFDVVEDEDGVIEIIIYKKQGEEE